MAAAKLQRCLDAVSMEHPFISNRTILIIYCFLILFLGAAQAVFNVVFEILPLAESIADGLIFALLLGALGLSVWFVVRYNNLEDGSSLQIISNHLVAAIVFAVMWFLVAGSVVRAFLQSENYSTYLKGNMAERIAVGLLFYVLMASVCYMYILYQRNRQKILHEAELEKQIRDARLNVLKSQINPHFLFNSLNSIASLTIADPGKAHEMVIALSGFMRYSLRRHNGDLVTLEEELQTIGLYLQIEKIRFGEKLEYSFEVEKECLKCRLPNLVLQPLFENAIKYGVYEAVDPVSIRLDAVINGDMLQISIANDFDPESIPARGEGVGLKNVQERLRILYGSNNLVKTEKSESRFVVTIFIPIDIVDNK